VQIGGYSGAPYSVRYSEAGFETPAVVGNLSQSSATTGRAVGHTKSRRLYSLLGGAERRAGIIVLPPRSTFRQAHSTPTTSRRGRATQLVDWSYGTRPRCLATARSPCPTSWAAGHRLRVMRQTWARWRDEARGAARRRQTHRSPFDALCWRGKLLLLTDHGRRPACPAHEGMVERGRSLVAKQPSNLRQ